jgi:ribose transport system permease protein
LTPTCSIQSPPSWSAAPGGRGGMGNTIVGLFVLGVLNNGLDHVNIDSFLKILIRGLILLAALVINVYAQRLRARTVD